MEKLNPEDILSIEELKPEDILSVEEQEKPKSTLESIGESASDIARGVGSGLTMGGLEEIIAAGQATFSPEEDEWSKKYRKFLEIQEQKTKEAEERSPAAMFGGELVGSFAPAFLTGGATLAASGGKAAAQLATKELLKKAGKGLGVGAVTGLGGGAVSGALTSEEGALIGATEEEKQKLLEDIKSGAITGGALGGLLGGGVPLIVKGFEKTKTSIGKKLKEFPLGEELATAEEMGLAGKGYATSESIKARLAEKEAAVQDIRDFLTKPEKLGVSLETAAAKEFKEPLNALTEAQFKVNLPEKVYESIEFLEKKVDPSLSSKLYKMAVEGVTPLEAYELRTNLKRLAKDNPEISSSLGSLWKNIDDSIEELIQSDEASKMLKELNLPTSYKKGLKTYSDVLTSTIESITEEGKPVDARRRFFHELAHEDATLDEKIKKLVNKYSTPGTISETAKLTVESERGGIIPLLDKLSKEKPEEMQRIANRMGFESPEDLKNTLFNKIKKASKEAVVSRVIQGQDPRQSGLRIEDILSRKPLLLAANIKGQALKAAKETAENIKKIKPIDISRKIYNLPEEGLRSMSARLSQSTKYGKYGANLQNAIDSGDSVKKQAVLFTLMQDPEFRNDISNFLTPDFLSSDED